MYNGVAQNVQGMYARVQQVTSREYSADPEQGSGLSDTTDVGTKTMQETQAPHSAGNPIAWILFWIAAFFLFRWILTSMGEKVDGAFSEVKLSVWNMFIVTLFAIPGFVIAKTLTVKYLAPNNPLRVIVTAA